MLAPLRMRALLLSALVLAGVLGVVAVLMTLPGRAPAESAPAQPSTPPFRPRADDPASTALREVVPAEDAGQPDPVADSRADEATSPDDPAPPPALGDRALIPEHEPYESMSLAELEAFEDRLEGILSERESPEHEALVRLGLGERLPGEEIHPTQEDSRTLTAYTSLSGVAGHIKTTLPREDHPQLYALKDEILQIRDLVMKRKRAEHDQ